MAGKASSGSKGGGSKKTGSKKSPTKKSRAKKPLLLTMAAAGPGNCLSLSRAGRIVQEAANGPHDVDKTLLEVGFITADQRNGFRRDVRNKVLQQGCSILEDDIPNGPDDTLRDIRDTVQAEAE